MSAAGDQHVPTWRLPNPVPKEGQPGRLEAVDRLVAEGPRRFQENYDKRKCRTYNYPYQSQEFVTALNTGRAMSPDAWQDRRLKDQLLKQQTEDLADALERSGIPARGCKNVFAVGLITGEVELLNTYRSLCILPSVAQRDRRPMLNELRLFRSKHKKHRFMRFAVVTNGATVPIGGMPPLDIANLSKDDNYFELRQRIQDLARTCSRFADWARTQWQIDVQFRGTEFTIKNRDCDDALSAHPHANLLYTPRRRLRRREWDQFLEEASAQFDGYWWKDCGVLEDPNEAIKYAFKPVELTKLDDAGVRWLYEQTFRLKMTQPMGEFQQWRNDTLWESNENGDGKTTQRKARKVITLEFADGSRKLDIVTVRKRPATGSGKLSGEPREGPPAENVVLSVTTPQRRFSPYAEPCALVMNYTDSPCSDWGRDALRELKEQSDEARPIWFMNGAPGPGGSGDRR